ncbi:MAG: NAD(P)/FAD-dependent oxidoreductase [Oscillospiraceae bacterium]|nr:NAD(P)/FAD-dependent oxidoreductase [Oscillospiraceae bacterium]
MKNYDTIIIGGGPAGISAALTLRSMRRDALLISGDYRESGLYRAARVDNYPGLPEISGRELLERFYAQAEGVERVRGLALSAVKVKGGFMVSVGAEVYSGRTLILAIGAERVKALPGELELLGRGVSYCAVCDGALYKGKRVAAVKLRADCEEDLEILRRFGCEVTELDASEVHDLRELDYACVFVLRSSVSASALLPGLEFLGGVETNIANVFAAGDCVGKPLQIAKAVGEGQVAAFAASAAVNG